MDAVREDLEGVGVRTKQKNINRCFLKTAVCKVVLYVNTNAC